MVVTNIRKNYFGPARYYCVETIVAPCGVVLAWTNFAKSESPHQILGFLDTVFPTPQEKPSYVCIDKGCLVLRSAQRQPWWQHWLNMIWFIVDSYHYQNHKRTDELCRKYCNPSPPKGVGAPNLVVLERDRNRE